MANQKSGQVANNEHARRQNLLPLADRHSFTDNEMSAGLTVASM